MKIVIDIPDIYYSACREWKINGVATMEQGIIANGTPLPKGHGRLINEMEVLRMTESYKSELGRLKADPFVKCGIETVEGFIQNVPTIIEADND